MRKLQILLLTVIIFGLQSNASPTIKGRGCATVKVHKRLESADPTYRDRIRNLDRRIAGRIAVSETAQTTAPYTIPVVFHVIYKDAEQNIPDAQIESQIQVLNDDFNRLNLDASKTPSVFLPVAGNLKVKFVKALRDPKGKATNGIVRVKTKTAQFSSNDDVKFTSKGGSDAWPSDRYLNFWIAKLGDGLLGYAQFPEGPAETDGVVITYQSIGRHFATNFPAFDEGRSGTHEIGHWIGLNHIWGDDYGCDGSDHVSDTPNQLVANFGIPSFPHPTCGNDFNASNEAQGDMFMNYMDYTNDPGMNMFSAGQVARMSAVLDLSRSALQHSLGGTAP